MAAGRMRIEGFTDEARDEIGGTKLPPSSSPGAGLVAGALPGVMKRWC